MESIRRMLRLLPTNKSLRQSKPRKGIHADYIRSAFGLLQLLFGEAIIYGSYQTQKQHWALPNICRRKALNYMHWLAKAANMPVTQATSFQCPTCGAEYKLVRIETKEVVPDQQTNCRKCGSQLPGSEGYVILKYFLVDRGRRRLQAPCRGSCAR